MFRANGALHAIPLGLDNSRPRTPLLRESAKDSVGFSWRQADIDFTLATGVAAFLPQQAGPS